MHCQQTVSFCQGTWGRNTVIRGQALCLRLLLLCEVLLKIHKPLWMLKQSASRSGLQALLDVQLSALQPTAALFCLIQFCIIHQPGFETPSILLMFAKLQLILVQVEIAALPDMQFPFLRGINPVWLISLCAFHFTRIAKLHLGVLLSSAARWHLRTSRMIFIK